MKEIKWNESGLVPVVVQDLKTKEVLMVAYSDEEAIRLTKETGFAYFYSRSRNSLWKKGETSGNLLKVSEIRMDCDGDTLLYLVKLEGSCACHTGHYSCFYRSIEGEELALSPKDLTIFDRVSERVLNRKENPKEGSYTNYLFQKGIDKILKKVAEESGEVIIAAKNKDPYETVYETADLFYHIIVLLAEKGISLDEIREELEKRFQKN